MTQSAWRGYMMFCSGWLTQPVIEGIAALSYNGAMKSHLRLLFAIIPAALLLLSAPNLCAAQLSSAARPNFIFILVDDLGWTDLGCYGSKFYETPNIDRLAAGGMRFTQAYSACTVCSPTRASVLTGQYPARLRITDWIAGHVNSKAKLKVPDWTKHLPLDQMNIAKSLKPAGYASVSIGKWHLGGPPFYPEKQGFDANIGGTDKGQPPSYFSPYRISTLPDGPAGEFLTDRESAEALKFIEKNKDEPFFLYLPHYAVHQPIAGKKEVIEKFQQKANQESPQRNATYAALIQSVDDSVGNILRKLDELSLSERTVVIFTSDNGGLIGNAARQTTSNHPLRVGKGSAYEGGVRVPLIVRWPGQTQPGSICDAPVISPDFYPSMLEIAGVKEASNHVVDGESLVPLLKQAGSLKRAAIYWHYPHYHPGGATPYGAVRSRDFKLIEFYEDDRVELYNLKDDIGEKSDLANQMPAKANELRSMLVAWRKAVQAQMPSPNPDYDSANDVFPAHVIKQAADGTLVLHAKDVAIHGTTVRYEPQPHKNTVGYWTKADDWVSWEFQIVRTGAYRVEILQGCGPRSGGSEVEFSANGQTLAITVVETKGFQDFLAREIGTLRFERPGRYTLSVKPKRKPGVAVMDLRSVTLRPE
jgi:arylsulfatase A